MPKEIRADGLSYFPRPAGAEGGIAYKSREEMCPLLLRMLDASGGLDTFRRYRGVVITGRIGGWALLKTALLARNFRPWRGPFVHLRGGFGIDFVNEYVETYPLPRPRDVGVRDGADCRIVSVDSGEVLQRSVVSRADFATKFYWNTIRCAYMIGYSVWNYFQMPFLYARRGFECEEIEPRASFGRMFRRLRVTSPATLHSHGRQTICWVDPDSGLIDHFSYHLEIGGWYSRFNHYLSDYQSFDGIVVAGRRRAFHRAEPFVRIRRHLDWCFAAMDGLVERAEFIVPGAEADLMAAPPQREERLAWWLRSFIERLGKRDLAAPRRLLGEPRE